MPSRLLLWLALAVGVSHASFVGATSQSVKSDSMLGENPIASEVNAVIQGTAPGAFGAEAQAKIAALEAQVAELSNQASESGGRRKEDNFTSIALTSMTVGNTKMCLGQHPDACPVTAGQHRDQFKSLPASVRKVDGGASAKHIVKCPGNGYEDTGAGRCVDSQISTMRQPKAEPTSNGGGLKALVNLKREMTFLNDGGRNCLCDPYVQVNALKPEIVTQVVLEIPGKRVCNGVDWWGSGKKGVRDAHNFFKVDNYGINFNSSVIGGSGTQGCHGGCMQPRILSPYLRVALHYRASEDGNWTEYGPSFFFDTVGPYTMKLDSAITAKQLRMVMVCSDSVSPAAFPTSFTGWGYAAGSRTRSGKKQYWHDGGPLNGREGHGENECVPTEADDCSCTFSSKDRCPAESWQCPDAARTVKVSLQTDITYFGWDNEVRDNIKQMLEKSASVQLGDALKVRAATTAVAFTLGGTNTNYPGYGCLSGANDVRLNDVDLAGCKTACINDSSCKSIDFYVGKNKCSISYSNFGDVGKTSSTSDCRFYEIDRSAVSSEVTNLGPDDQASSDSGGTASETSATGAHLDSSPSAAGSFGHTAAVNCNAVNNDTDPLGKILDKHFSGWQTPGDGQYVQEPHEHKDPELITLSTGNKWHVVVSKRNKGKDVFLVEKRLVCFREVQEENKENHMRLMVCCVTKQIGLADLTKKAASLTVEQNKTKAAILRNF